MAELLAVACLWQYISIPKHVEEKLGRNQYMVVAKLLQVAGLLGVAGLLKVAKQRNVAWLFKVANSSATPTTRPPPTACQQNFPSIWLVIAAYCQHQVMAKSSATSNS